MVAYNGYIQTDLAQSNLFSVLTVRRLFSLVVIHLLRLKHRSYTLNFELCILVAQNYSIRVAKPFESHCKSIRIALPNLN